MSALDDEPISEVQLEIAFLSCLTRNRPIGIYKDIVILKLQNEIYQRTRVWLELGNLWSRLGEMYDLKGIEALNRTQHAVPPDCAPEPALHLLLSTAPTQFLPAPPSTKRRTSFSPSLPDSEEHQHDKDDTGTGTTYAPSISTPPTPGFSPSDTSTPFFNDESIPRGDTPGMISPIEGDDKAIRGRSESTVSTAASGSAKSSAPGMARAASGSGTSSGGSETTVICVGSSSQTIQSLNSSKKEGGKEKGARGGIGKPRGEGKRWVSGRNGVHKPVIAGVVVSTGQKGGDKRSGGMGGEMGERKGLIVSVPKEKKRKIN